MESASCDDHRQLAQETATVEGRSNFPRRGVVETAEAGLGGSRTAERRNAMTVEVQEAIQDQLSAEKLVADYRAYKGSRLHGRSIANANWVTTLAHECEAYAVYMRTVPAEQ